MSLVIRAAARTLPAGIRDRYREQWLADARDATEAGLSPASIALAAVSFAVTYDRPLPSRPARAMDPERRARLALGLAFSAALLSLSTYPMMSFGGLTNVALWDFTVFFVTALLVVYAVLAPITALVLVRGARARWAVGLLAIATTAPIAATLVAGWIGYADYAGGASLAFGAAAVLVVAACALVWRPNGHSLRAPLIGGFAVWAITGAGVVYGSRALASSIPPDFGIENAALYDEWLQGELQFRGLVADVLVGWAILGIAVGILVFLIGRVMSSSRAAGLAVGAAAFALLGASGVFGFIYLGMDGVIADVLLGPLRLGAQVLLVATTLVSVGGVRYLPRVGHRHDVESGVELL